MCPLSHRTPTPSCAISHRGSPVLPCPGLPPLPAHPVTKGPCPRDKPEPPQVTYNAVPPHEGDLPPSEPVPPRPCQGQCCDTVLVSHPPPPPRPSPLLVAVGGFPELVGHHFGGEVVEVEHVLEEGVLRDLVLVRKRDEEGYTGGSFPRPVWDALGTGVAPPNALSQTGPPNRDIAPPWGPPGLGVSGDQTPSPRAGCPPTPS